MKLDVFFFERRNLDILVCCVPFHHNLFSLINFADYSDENILMVSRREDAKLIFGRDDYKADQFLSVGRNLRNFDIFGMKTGVKLEVLIGLRFYVRNVKLHNFSGNFFNSENSQHYFLLNLSKFKKCSTSKYPKTCSNLQ